LSGVLGPVRPPRRALRASLALLTLFSLAAGLASIAAIAAEKGVLWKVSDQALLRVDDRPVKDWNIYQAGKKANPLLLQIGNRYLLVDGREHQVFEIDPGKIEHQGAELSWDPANRPAKSLETSDWIVRDVGLAYKISTRLVAENHLLDLQIPHPLDVRGIYR
jgi:hypothetical protein